MTYTENILQAMSKLITESKSDRFYNRSKHKYENGNLAKKYDYEGRYIAYRTAAEYLEAAVNAATKYTGTLEELEERIKEVGVKSWIENGKNILEIGDNWLGNQLDKHEFARLPMYQAFNALWFCGYFDTTDKCGQIILNDGTIVCYNINQEPEDK